MKVLLNNEGFIVSYAIVGNLVGAIDIDVDKSMLDHFKNNYRSYKLIDGNIVFDQNQHNKIAEQQALSSLRFLREKECFPVINRGELWYKHLTTDQITELDIWYQAWLDVTETKVIPNKPTWIN